MILDCHPGGSCLPHVQGLAAERSKQTLTYSGNVLGGGQGQTRFAGGLDGADQARTLMTDSIDRMVSP